MEIIRRQSIAGNPEFAVQNDSGEIVGVFKSELIANQMVDAVKNGLDFENPELANYDEIWADELNKQKGGEVL